MPDFFKETAAPSTNVYPDQNQGISTMSEPAYSTKNIDWFGANNKELDLSVLSQPTYFDPVAKNFNKYKQSDYFNQLGFFAGADNEEIYGNTQTFGNKFSNALSGAFDIAKYQFVDQLKGWGRMTDALTSWDSTKLYGDPEEQDKEMKDILNRNAIFMNEKDRDSIFNWSKVFNTVQQTGYTFGALAEIAFEELLTFGAATALQGTKVGRLLKNMSMWGKDAAQLEKTLNQTNKLRTAFREMSEYSAKLPVLGNTLDFTTKLAGFGAKNGEDLAALTGRGFGAFYRDLRELNAAMTEARAEAGGTYADLRQTLINQEGDNLNIEKLNEIDKVARDAAKTNFGINTAIISVSNKIQFDGVFKGIAGAKRMFEDGAIGSLGSKFFSRGFNKATLIEGLKKRPIAYLKNNLSEALQENLQEASNVGVKQYYEQIYNKEAASFSKALSQGLNSQLSKEGFETFLAGFATGAIVGPTSKGIKWVYNRFSTTKEERQQKQDATNETVKQLNELFSGERGPALAKSLLTTKQMQDAALSGDKKSFQDAKDEHIRNTARLLIETGQKDKYFDMLEESSKELSKAEFEEAFGVDFKSDGKNSIGEYIGSLKEKVETLEKDNTAFEYKFGTNPFQPSQVEYKAWTNAKWHVLNSKHAHIRAIQRITELNNSLPSSLQNINAQSVLPLFDETLFQEEKKLLQEELKVTTDPQFRRNKEKRLEILNKIEQKDKESLNPEESYNQDLYSKYLKQLAKENKVELTEENLQETLGKIRDIKNLRLDEKSLLNNVNWLVDPKNVQNLRQQHLNFLNKKLEEFEQKSKPKDEPKVKEEPKETENVDEQSSTGATFQKTDPITQKPSGETFQTSTESITSLVTLPLDEIFELIYNSDKDFPTTPLNTVEEILDLVDEEVLDLLKQKGITLDQFKATIENLYQQDENELTDFQDKVLQVSNLKKTLQKNLQTLEKGEQLNEAQIKYLEITKKRILSNNNLKELYEEIQQYLKPKPKQEVVETPLPFQEIPVIEGLEIQEEPQVIQVSEARTAQLEVNKGINPQDLDLPFTSIMTKIKGDFIRFVNTPEGKELINSLGLQIQIQNITPEFFNGHKDVNEKWISDNPTNPYTYSKNNPEGKTTVAFVLADKQGNPVYLNPNFFGNQEEDFTTTSDKGVKLAINLPQGTNPEFETPQPLSLELLQPVRGGIDEFKNGTLTTLENFLRDAEVPNGTNVVKAPFVGQFMVMLPEGPKRNGGLYFDLQNGASIKLLPTEFNNINVNGEKISLDEILTQTYSAEDVTKMLEFLNSILQTNTNTANPFYRAQRGELVDGKFKIEIKEFQYTEFGEKGLPKGDPSQTTSNPIQIRARLKRINIFAVDFRKDMEITVPLQGGFTKMSYNEFVRQNVLTNKKRYIDPISGKILIQTVNDGFQVPNLKTEIKIQQQKVIKELQELLKCLS